MKTGIVVLLATIDTDSFKEATNADQNELCYVINSSIQLDVHMPLRRLITKVIVDYCCVDLLLITVV